MSLVIPSPSTHAPWTRVLPATARVGLPIACNPALAMAGELGSVEVQDVVLHCEITADGPWWSATVYFHDEESTVSDG